jgi:hypothetical protein
MPDIAPCVPTSKKFAFDSCGGRMSLNCGSIDSYEPLPS